MVRKTSLLRKKNRKLRKKLRNYEIFCQLFPQRTQTSSCSLCMKISANSRKNGAKNVIFFEKIWKKKCPPPPLKKFSRKIFWKFFLEMLPYGVKQISIFCFPIIKYFRYWKIHFTENWSIFATFTKLLSFWHPAFIAPQHALFYYLEHAKNSFWISSNRIDSTMHLGPLVIFDRFSTFSDFLAYNCRIPTFHPLSNF